MKSAGGRETGGADGAFKLHNKDNYKLQLFSNNFYFE
jgi:hypothetical protein